MLADEMFPTKFKPTLFHVFMALVHQKGHLLRVFTQNIDTLERLTGIIPESRIVEAHGSFAKNHCIACGYEMSSEDLKLAMYGDNETSTSGRKEGSKIGIPRCKNKKCKAKGEGLVKPDIVFFGEGLPVRFFDLADDDMPQADLAIVAGTSLTVYPFASLPEDVSDSCPRLLFNSETVGEIGTRENDVLALGDCDEEVRKFAELCGWGEELETLRQQIVGDIKGSGEQLASKSVPDDNASEVPATNTDTGKVLGEEEEEGERVVVVAVPIKEEDDESSVEVPTSIKGTVAAESESDQVTVQVDNSTVESADDERLAKEFADKLKV